MRVINLIGEGFLSELNTVPKKPGVYRFLDTKDQPIYIGKAKNLNSRVRSYFSKANARNKKISALIEETISLDFTKTISELDALLLEQHLIKKYLPKFNIQFKDGKGYPFIRLEVSKDFPAANVHLGSKENSVKYFGPYPNTYAVRDVLSLIQNVFKLRNCSDSFFKHRTRPCMQYQINKCSAPCVGFINKDDYVKEVKSAEMLLSGRGEHLVKGFYQQMDTYSSKKQYEMASKYRDKISSLREVQRAQSISGFEEDVDAIIILKSKKNIFIGLTQVRGGWVVGHKNFIQIINKLDQNLLESFIKSYYLSISTGPSRIISNQSFNNKKIIQKLLNKHFEKEVRLTSKLSNKDKGLLKLAETNSKQVKGFKGIKRKKYEEGILDIHKIFKFKKEINRLEGYDISHQSGKNAIGACVTYGKKGKNKQHFRLYKISEQNSGNDIASMTEIIRRRFERSIRENQKLPELLIIDGGKVHLKKVKEILNLMELKDIEIISVSKGGRRKPEMDLFNTFEGKSLKYNASSKGMLLIQEIRNEAHRLCVTNLYKARRKLITYSELDDIPGVGQVTKQKLLRYFGSIAQLKRASKQDIERILGVGKTRANIIKKSLSS